MTSKVLTLYRVVCPASPEVVSRTAVQATKRLTLQSAVSTYYASLAEAGERGGWYLKREDAVAHWRREIAQQIEDCEVALQQARDTAARAIAGERG